MNTQQRRLGKHMTVAVLMVLFSPAGLVAADPAPETGPLLSPEFHSSDDDDDQDDDESGGGEWPLYSHDFNNSNFNPDESVLSPRNARFMRRAWETFNDSSEVEEEPPTGFVLESVLGLEFPSAVVGVVASPIIRGATQSPMRWSSFTLFFKAK